MLPQNQVKFDRPIVEHADQWAALVVQIQRLGKYLRDYAASFLKTWKKNTRFYRDKVEVIYLSAEQIELQNQIKALEDEKEGLEKEYSQAVGLAFTGMAGLLFSGPLGIISWSITGGIYGNKAEKIRKEKDTIGEKIAELQNELTACSGYWVPASFNGLGQY